MFTVCSKCNLRLTVTASDLRAAQGYVRCGRCHNVFSALASLSEETPDTTGVHRTNTAQPAAEPTAPTAPTRQATPTPANPAPVATVREAPARSETRTEVVAPAPAAERGPAAERAPAADRPGKAAAVPSDSDLEFDLAQTDVEHIFITAAPASHETGTFESIILHGAGELEDSEDDSVRVMQLPSEELAALAAAAEQAARAQAQLRTGGAAGAPSLAAVEASLTPAAQGDAAARSGSVLPRVLRSVACALLALGLVLQAVHHWRGSLAAIEPVRPLLTQVYAALGMPLQPDWDASRYEVRQLGAQSDAQASAGLEVRASIKNTAQRAQPLPLLRVTLEDRFGNRIAARDLEPREYLSSVPAGGMLAAGARVDAVVTLVDPGQAATGFELDACLRQGAGRVTCANDPATH